MRERLNLWARREFKKLWEPIRLNRGRTAAIAAELVPEDKEALASRNRKRMTKYARIGALSKGSRSSSSLGLAPNSAATCSALRRLHPERSSNISSPLGNENEASPADEDLLRVDPGAVWAAIMSFGRASTGGSSGMAPDHLRSLLSSSIDGCASPETVERFLENMTGVVHVLPDVIAPPSLDPFICGANFFDLRKEFVGAVRPLACGEALRRLVSNFAFRSVPDDTAKFLGPQISGADSEDVLGEKTPVQVGVGIECGSEVFVHSVQNLVDSFGKYESLGLLTDDMLNSFNMVDMQAMVDEVAAHFLSLLPWVLHSYKNALNLFGKCEHFSSQQGCQKGDPLGPFLFSLVLKGVLDIIAARLLEEFGDVACKIFCHYLDDSVLSLNTTSSFVS